MLFTSLRMTLSIFSAAPPKKTDVFGICQVSLPNCQSDSGGQEPIKLACCSLCCEDTLEPHIVLSRDHFRFSLNGAAVLHSQGCKFNSHH